MTKSAHKFTPRRAAFNKFVRQRAHQEGILFNAALEKTFLPAGIKADYSSERHYRQHSGRKGMQKNSSVVDEGDLFIRNEDHDDVHDFKTDFNLIDSYDTSDTTHHTVMKVSLLDIARPAKQRGAAKDFEVVQKLRNVIVLEDNGLEYQWEDDEWEHIYDERLAEEQRSYSSVLRGNDSET